MLKPWMPDKLPKIPKSYDELERQMRWAYKQGRDTGIKEAINLTVGAMLYILLDKHGGTPEEIKQLSEEFDYAIESITDGYMSMTNVWKLLRECGVKPHMRR